MIHGPARRLAGGLLVLVFTGGGAGADGVSGPGTGFAAGFGQGFGPGVDWSLTGRLSLTTEVNSNRELDPDLSFSPLWTNRLDAGLSLGAKTKRGVYTIDLGLAGRVYLGPNQPDEVWPVSPRFAASALYTGKRYEFSSGFSFEVEPTSEAEFDDTVLRGRDDLQVNVNFNAALALDLSPRDRFTVSAAADAIDFLEGAPGLEASRNFTFGLGWAHTLDARTTVGLDTTFGFFTSENDLATRSQTIGVVASVTQQRTRRHTIGFSLGPTFVRTEERGLGTRFDVGVDGSANFGYKLRDIEIDLSLTQSVEPSTVGELQSFTRAGAGLIWTVNPEESLTFSADFTHRTNLDGSEPSDFARIGASYDLTLTREARLSVGYQFRAENDDLDGFSSDHQVFLTLTHDFTLLP